MHQLFSFQMNSFGRIAKVANGMNSVLRIWPNVRKFGRGLLNLALPPRCLHCDDDLSPEAEISLCLKCTQAIAPELGPCCDRCGAVLPEGFCPADRCPACKDFSLKFDAVYPLGRYEGALRELVLKDETPIGRSPFPHGRSPAGPAVGRKTGRISCRCRFARSPCIGPRDCFEASTVPSCWRTAWEENWGCRWCARWSVAVILVLRKTCCRGSDSATSEALSVSAGRIGNDGRTRVYCWSTISLPRAQRAAKSRGC